MISLFRNKLPEVLKAVVPLIGVISLLQLTLVQAPVPLFLQFLTGSVIAVIGMVLLLSGIDLGILPMGRFIGAQLPKRGSLTLIIVVAFSLGFAVTIAEPDVLILAGQIDVISGGAVRLEAVAFVVGLGVGISSAVAMVRIITGWSMRIVLTGAFSLILVLAAFAPPDFVPVAFDAGSVTTGVLTAPVMIALARGLTSVLAGRSAVSDGFGLLGFASIGPIFVILIVGILLS